MEKYESNSWEYYCFLYEFLLYFELIIETFLHSHAFPINSVKLHTVTQLRGLHVETLVEVRSSQKVQPFFLTACQLSWHLSLRMPLLAYH